MNNNDLADMITETCRQFTEETVQAVESGIEEIVTQAAQEIKATAPKKSGKYRRSWKVRKDRENGSITVTAYASGKSYRLTHLLENGHVTRDGTTRARAFPHIAPANEAAHAKAERLLEEVANGTK